MRDWVLGQKSFMEPAYGCMLMDDLRLRLTIMRSILIYTFLGSEAALQARARNAGGLSAVRREYSFALQRHLRVWIASTKLDCGKRYRCRPTVFISLFSLVSSLCVNAVRIYPAKCTPSSCRFWL
ncbi:hypothetical protein BDW22DRAFT_918889 [Trametopsis cervina]|nr:hypothetical protein BDW22DRAFT_918889 [Trametopsis cervina]